MRRFVWALPLCLVLLLSPSVAADEVSELRDLVQRLERTIGQLEDRVASLEQRVEALRGGGMPAVGRDERDVRPAPRASEVAGTYELDLEALVADDVDAMAKEEGLSPAETAELRRLVIAELADYRFDITLGRDGTFRMYLSVPEEEDLKRRGEWTLNGHKVEMQAIWQNGERLVEPDSTYADYKDGTLDVEGEEGASFTLRRR